jgi:aminoglycoside N3'-acetyltransferase
MKIENKIAPIIPVFLKNRVIKRRNEKKLEELKKTKPVTKKEIITDLKKFGLKKEDIVLVHSSLSAIGYVDGGADTVVNALLETVGPKGTVLMPVYPMKGTMLEYAKTDPLFNPKNDPSQMGKITEAFRLRKEALRSWHPTHSVAAIGPYAEYLLKNHEKSQTPCGKTSPFYKLIELDGSILHLGSRVGQTTSVHIIEDLVDDFPHKVYFDELIPMRYLDGKGVEHTVLIKVHDPVTSKTRIDKNIEKEKEIYKYCLEYEVVTTGKVGNARSHLIKARGLEEVLEKLLAKGITIY